MKHSLQLKLSQHLALTPQLQQSIRLLQLSTLELNQELERYLAENPLLERADLGSPDETAAAPPGNARRRRRDARQQGERERDRTAPTARDGARRASPTSTARRGARGHGAARAATTTIATTSRSSPPPSPRCTEHLHAAARAHGPHRARQAHRRAS